MTHSRSPRACGRRVAQADAVGEAGARELPEQQLGSTLGSRASFKVAADNVQCRVGNIDLTEHDCTLTFGAKTVAIEGREAQALFVTMGSNGVEAEGAMGSSYRAVKQLSCTIDPKAIAEKDGSGIHCSYASGP